LVAIGNKSRARPEDLLDAVRGETGATTSLRHTDLQGALRRETDEADAVTRVENLG